MARDVFDHPQGHASAMTSDAQRSWVQPRNGRFVYAPAFAARLATGPFGEVAQKRLRAAILGIPLDIHLEGDLRLRHELEGHRVHAVPGVPGRELLTDEDMTEVSAAGGALDFDALAIWIR